MNHLPPNNQTNSDAANIGRTRNFGRWQRAFHLGFFYALIVFAVGNVTARAQAAREYQLKAVFLFNFAQFTEWPQNAFTNDTAPIVIGVLGSDPFGPALSATVQGEKILGHPLSVEHYRRADEIKTCHVLFISQAEARHCDDIVKAIKGKPILTVADTDSASSAGAMIRFVVESNKVHFRINQEAARTADINLSSKLLRVAEASPPPGRTP